MKMFEASFNSLIWRYNLLIAVVVVGIGTGNFWMAGLALPIFLTCLLGISFKSNSATAKSTEGVLEVVPTNYEEFKKAA